MCSWQCGGCGVWYSYSVSSCKCGEYRHIFNSTGGSAPHIHQHTQPAICAFTGTCQYQNNGTAKYCRMPDYISGCQHKQQASA